MIYIREPWQYIRGIYNRDQYKSSKTGVQMLVDMVGKNGIMFLNIPAWGDGSIDKKMLKVAEGIAKGWIETNRNIPAFVQLNNQE